MEFYILQTPGPFPLLVPIQKTTIATRATVSIRDVILGESANIYVTLLNDNDDRIDNRIIKMEGQDYANWGTDDLYIQHFVQETLARETVSQ